MPNQIVNEDELAYKAHNAHWLGLVGAEGFWAEVNRHHEWSSLPNFVLGVLYWVPAVEDKPNTNDVHQVHLDFILEKVSVVRNFKNHVEVTGTLEFSDQDAALSGVLNSGRITFFVDEQGQIYSRASNGEWLNHGLPQGLLVSSEDEFSSVFARYWEGRGS